MTGTRSRWLVFLIGLALAASVEAQQKKPNILVLMSDDTGFGD